MSEEELFVLLVGHHGQRIPVCHVEEIVEKYLKVLFFRDLSLRSPIASFLDEFVLPMELLNVGDNVVFSDRWDPRHIPKLNHHGGHGQCDIAESRLFEP